jgi:hypothetical protein
MTLWFVCIVLGGVTFPSNSIWSHTVELNVTDDDLNFEFLFAAFGDVFCASIKIVLNQSTSFCGPERSQRVW